jgi:hypothetical protein
MFTTRCGRRGRAPVVTVAATITIYKTEKYEDWSLSQAFMRTFGMPNYGLYSHEEPLYGAEEFSLSIW